MPTARDRERMLKSVLIVVVGLPFAILFWMQSPPPKPKPVEPITQAEPHTKESEVAQSDKTQPESTPAETKPAALTPQISTTATPAADKPPPPTIDKLLAESRRKVTEAREAFVRVRDRADLQLLNKFGGNEWLRVQELQQQAEIVPQPTLAVEYWQQAKEQLTTLLPQLALRQQCAELQSLELAGDDVAFLAALREASKQHAHQFNFLWEHVSTWSDGRWFALCQSETKRMAPDDPGFAEIWLAVADYHETRRDLDAARTAIDQAWSNVVRMTQPVRATESGIEWLRRCSAPASSQAQSEKRDAVAALIGQIRDRVRRLEFFADLAALAAEQGDASAAERYRRSAEEGLNNNDFTLAFRCRAMAASATPDQLFDIAGGIRKNSDSSNSDIFAANTIAYSQIARAAVRTNNQQAFWRSQFLAEIQQLDAADFLAANPVVRCLIAQADVAQRKWRRAVITANNVADPSLRASVLFLVMQAAPAEVPAEIGLELIALRPADRGAARAMVTYLPHQLSGERSIPEWIDWIVQLKHSSSRAAAYLALARHAANPIEPSFPTPGPPPMPNLEDARSLVEAAESTANTIQEPLSRAYAQLWIAVCWHRLQKPASYTKAYDQLDNELFKAWRDLWRSRPPANTSVSKGWYADQPDYRFQNDYRNKQDFTRRHQAILECTTLLAETQAFHLHDSRRAVESALDAARASHSLSEAKADSRIRLRTVVETIRDDCELPTGLMEGTVAPSNDYLQMLVAVPTADLNSLKKLVQNIETGKLPYQYNKNDCAARGHAEVARMAARLGQLDDYRAARRSAISLMETRNATDLIRLPLLEADALAGEFELALQAKRPREPLPLYGTIARPLSTLCVELCRANRLLDAEKQLSGINEPFWKLRAMHAIAAARLRDRPSENHLEWATKLDDPFLRVAAYCGLALREPRLW